MINCILFNEFDYKLTGNAINSSNKSMIISDSLSKRKKKKQSNSNIKTIFDGKAYGFTRKLGISEAEKKCTKRSRFFMRT